MTRLNGHVSGKKMGRLKPRTVRAIADMFESLDYAALGRIYCDEGGEAFWKDRKEPCQELGIKYAEMLRERLKRKGRSLYVGAGVAEIPLLTMETMERARTVRAYNMRADEVRVLNGAGRGKAWRLQCDDAANAKGTFDHICLVSVLNDPEHYSELSALAYGRANPMTFDPAAFAREREETIGLADVCLGKLETPGLVTTSIEEIPWITDWCTKRGMRCVVEKRDFPTAIVGDPVCLIRVG